MGNHHSTSDLIHTYHENIFKVDNINSYGRRHSSAKIHLSDNDLCIHQKHRQSLFIPFDTIKRYGLDGSIFILECGRRAPLGQGRYAFRCKKARHLVYCLDQRITMISNQLLEQQYDESSLNLTNVSSTLNRRSKTQSSISLTSTTSFYRNSLPDLSDNYFTFENENQEYRNSIELNYTEFKVESQHSNSSMEKPRTNEKEQSNVMDSNHENDSTVQTTFISNTSTKTKSYVSIDYDKTITLKEIAEEQLLKYPQRVNVQ